MLCGFCWVRSPVFWKLLAGIRGNLTDGFLREETAMCVCVCVRTHTHTGHHTEFDAGQNHTLRKVKNKIRFEAVETLKTTEVQFHFSLFPSDCYAQRQWADGVLMVIGIANKPSIVLLSTANLRGKTEFMPILFQPQCRFSQTVPAVAGHPKCLCMLQDTLRHYFEFVFIFGSSTFTLQLVQLLVLSPRARFDSSTYVKNGGNKQNCVKHLPLIVYTNANVKYCGVNR